jgi:hypothetical protein
MGTNKNWDIKREMDEGVKFIGIKIPLSTFNSIIVLCGDESFAA